MKQQYGLTLIELMIVVLLLALLAMAASPFTSRWVDNARITETLGIMEQAVGQARAAALRNPALIIGDTPASIICNTDGEIRVRLPVLNNTTLNCTSATPPAQPWTSKLPRNTSLKASGTSDWACVCFNNKGLVTQEAACSGCSDNLTLTILSGAESESDISMQ